jgi:hypothetical protein
VLVIANGLITSHMPALWVLVITNDPRENQLTAVFAYAASKAR